MKAYILISAMILALLNGTAMARDIEIGTILQSQPRYQEQIQKREEGGRVKSGCRCLTTR